LQCCGSSAADPGCGGGVASIVLARAFANIRSFGYDPYMRNITRAADAARKAG